MNTRARARATAAAASIATIIVAFAGGVGRVGTEPQGMTIAESNAIESRLARIERAVERSEDRLWWQLLLTGGVSGLGTAAAAGYVNRRNTNTKGPPT